MLQMRNSSTRNAEVAGFSRGLGKTSARTMTSMKHHGALLATFAIALVAPVVYVVAAIAGWIDWAAGLPAAAVAPFLAWTCAIRINELTRSPTR